MYDDIQPNEQKLEQNFSKRKITLNATKIETKLNLVKIHVIIILEKNCIISSNQNNISRKIMHDKRTKNKKKLT